MILPMPVFREVEARDKRGSEASEMLMCPECNEQKGVMISLANRMECKGISTIGCGFDVIVWERWRCVGCGVTWMEKYGIAIRGEGDS